MHTVLFIFVATIILFDMHTEQMYFRARQYQLLETELLNDMIVHDMAKLDLLPLCSTAEPSYSTSQ